MIGIQTKALLLDAYRDLNSRKMFWVVLLLNVIVVAGFSAVGVTGNRISIFSWRIPQEIPIAQFVYKWIFTYVIVGRWLTWAATIMALISTASIFPEFMAGGPLAGGSAVTSLSAAGDVAGDEGARDIADSIGHGVVEGQWECQPVIRSAALQEAREVTVADVPWSAVQERPAGGCQPIHSVPDAQYGFGHELPRKTDARREVLEQHRERAAVTRLSHRPGQLDQFIARRHRCPILVR